MTVFNSPGLILAPTFRSRAILQMMEHAGISLGAAVILPGVEPAWNGAASISLPLHRLGGTWRMRPREPLRETLSKMKVPVFDAPASDVNSAVFIDFLKTTKPAVYVYSGIAGCILRKPILTESGKRFLHAHGGDAPRYSGSTSFYYSILERGDMAATVFWMNEGLDTGDVVEKLICPPVSGIEIDRIQDPAVRAEAFAMALQKLRNGDMSTLEQDHGQRVTYHVIHPVLKHYALDKCGLGTGRRE